MVTGIGLSVVCLALTVVPEPGLGVARPTSIACNDELIFDMMTAIPRTRVQILKITDGKSGHWQYANHRHVQFGGQQLQQLPIAQMQQPIKGAAIPKVVAAGKAGLAATAEGTFELAGDLVVFSGKDGSRDIRFALNYGKQGEHLRFNQFFPSGKNELSYQRRWYRLVKGRWLPAMEVKLTAPRNALPDKDTWKLPLKGSVRRWSPAGKESVIDIDTVVEYRKREQAFAFVGEGPSWYPQGLRPEIRDDHVEFIQLESVATLRGFSPVLFDLPVGE